MEVCTLDLRANAFYGDKLEQLWTPAVSKVMDYGAKGYSFIREQEDPLHFIHLSYWEERLDFDRYWYSEEMNDLREQASGMYQVPLLPRWSTVVDHR